MSDGTDDQDTGVPGAAGTLGVDRDRDGDRDPAGHVGGGIRLPSVSYAMVRANDHGSVFSLYDIVEHTPGYTARIMATRVRYAPAVEITHALNSLRRE